MAEPPNYKSVVSQVQSPGSDCSRAESLKYKPMRPRSRTGSGGILRVDVNKPTLISHELGQEPPSPQPSVDRLSVTFAAEEKSVCSSDTSAKINFYNPGTPPLSCMEKVRFPTITDGEDSDDYSASVTAIIQRRASTRKSRKRGRRTSSPFMHDQDGLQVRRRSSCFTTSSGDTAISMEESLGQEVTQEQIWENIRLHKEVLSSVKMQPWGMRRKLKLVQQAKSYIKQHRGALQERLAQSRSTRDILARWNIYLVQKLQHYKRELANLSNFLIPWEKRIKQIESHFGSVVASYFTFLRWLFWVNLIISVFLVAFVAIPELLTADPKSAGERKTILPEEKRKATNLFTLWDFEGILKYSPMFYGYYTNRDGTEKGYRLPFAYFMTGLLVYIYSFVATLRKMAENSRMSKLSEKDDECVFSWKLFTGWDYMIGNAETAQNRIASIILGFKEALLEEAEKKREPRNWKIIASRVLVNLVVLALLGISAYAVVIVVQRSTDEEAIKKSFWRRNETTIVMSLITFIFPILFEILGFFEHYHPRKQLRLQLARIMVLNILNLYSLIFSLFDKITDMTKELQQMKNETIYFDTIELTTDIDVTTLSNVENQTCYEIIINCTDINPLQTASFILSNLTLLYLLSNWNQTQNNTSNTNLNVPPILDHKFKRNVDTTEDYTEETTDYYDNTGEYFDFDYSYETTTVKSIINDYEETTDYAETTDYYEDDDIYFNFDYSTLTTTELSIDTKNTQTEDYEETEDYEDSDYTNFDYTTTKEIITQTVITTLLSTLVSENIENSTETVTVLWNTDELISEVYSTLNSLNTSQNETGSTTENTDDWTITENMTKSITENTDDWTTTENVTNSTTENTDDWTTTENVTNSTTENIEKVYYEWNTTKSTTTYAEEIKNYTTAYTTQNITSLTTYENITDFDINATISDIFKELTTKSTLCRKSQCDPIITVKNPSSNAVLTTKPPSYDYNLRKKLRKLCWETMFGQELVKLTVMDLSFTIISILAVDFIRAIFVRVMNNCWCWDLEKKFPQYGDFKIAENILHLVNNQGMVWMGMFFSPGIIIINLVKLAIMMYLRSWAVLACNVPHEVVFKASRSNNFYLALLLTMLFLCVLPVGFAIVWIEPSWHCGPFSNYSRIYHIFTKSLKNALPEALRPFLDYIASPFIVIPLLVLLILIIYYMISLTNALREANNDLKIQLRRERTEERRKMFQIADRRRRNGSGDSGDLDGTPFGKWKKLLTTLPNSKSFENDTSGKENEANEDKNENKDFLVKFIKKAIKKPETVSPGADDATDTEQHESLPEDVNSREKERDKKAMNTFRKLLNAKKQQRDAEAARRAAEMNSSSEKDKNITKYKSTSRSSSSKDLRQDSVTSNWSDNIPVIKISGTESSECILEHQNECSPLQSHKPRKITHQDNVDIDTKSDDIPVTELQIAEPQVQSTSSSETVVTIKMEKPENKQLLKDKKETTIVIDQIENKNLLKDTNINISVDDQNEVQKSSHSDSTQKSESSTEYKE